jgi:predicted transcriptional regulator
MTEQSNSDLPKAAAHDWLDQLEKQGEEHRRVAGLKNDEEVDSYVESVIAESRQERRNTGQGPEESEKDNVVKDAADFLAAVQVGIAQADRGEFIAEDEMDARVNRMLSPLPKQHDR